VFLALKQNECFRACNTGSRFMRHRFDGTLMAPSKRRLMGIGLLMTAVAYGMYRQWTKATDVGGGRDVQPAD
jgi:hypothetical protein